MASRILLADDSITIQKVVNRAFADEGIEVVAVSNGDHAERQLAEVNPDLVLADIFMPGKNGYELCEFIKQSPQFGHIPVVLLVGAFEPFDQVEAKRVRADDHLTKPFEFRTLVDTVRKLMSQNAQVRTGALPQMPQTEARPDESEARSTNPIPAPAVTPPPFKIDLAAMTDPVQPGEPANELPDNVSFNESAPLDLDDEPYQGTALLSPEQLGMVVESRSGARHNGDSQVWVGRTDELASLPDQEEDLALNSIDVQAKAPEAETINFSSGSSVAQDEATAHGTEVPSRFGYQAEEFLLDFEKTEPLSPPGLASEIPFDMEAAPLLDAESSASSLETEPEPDRDEADSFKTSMLEPPPAFRSTWDDSPSGSLARHEHSDYGRPSHSAEASPMRMEAAEVSAVLTVDDPLGDVLMDEATGRTYEAHTVMQSPDAQSDFDITGGMFAIEFIPDQESVRTEQAASQPVESYDTGELAGQSPDAQESEPAAEMSGDLSATAAQTAETSAEPVAQAYYPVEEPAPVEQVSEANAQEDVEAGAFAFEMAPDSESASAVAGAAPEAETDATDVETIAPEHAPHIEEQFTASSMWSEPETQFTAIDIEAVAVEEAVSPVEATVPETGFALSSEPAIVEATIAEPVDQAVPAEPSAPAEPIEAEPTESVAPVESTATPAQLSPEVIEEIVRRVVAEISDSVVREIAWEVVPDCVERVVERLTREGVSRRM
jgi:CheY-like chemotaxis protein